MEKDHFLFWIWPLALFCNKGHAETDVALATGAYTMPDFSNMLFSPQYAGSSVTLDLMSVMLVMTLSEAVFHW